MSSASAQGHVRRVACAAESAMATPLVARSRLERSIWDFYAGGKTPSTQFRSRYRPYSRRISFQPNDLDVDLEDERHHEALDGTSLHDPPQINRYSILFTHGILKYVWVLHSSSTEICQHRWKLFRLSPLLGFHESCLQDWERSLEEDLHVARESFSVLQDYQKITASVSIIPGLRGSAHDSSAIRIQIKSKQGRKVLTGILLSVDRHDLLNLNHLSAVILPVLLISGPEVCDHACLMFSSLQ